MIAGDRWRARYNAHLRSPEWAALRRLVFELRGRRCERCGSADRLHLHHLHYETLGRERPEDVEILCTDCHPIADDERMATARRRARNARYRARLDGWASRRYGEEWADSGHTESIEEEFRDWLDRYDD